MAKAGQEERDYNYTAMRVAENRHVILHSGYGGGQYVGRVGEVIKPDRGLPTLCWVGEVWRYQPRDSTGGVRLDDDVLYWNILDSSRGRESQLGLKSKDNLYVLPGKPDLKWFIENKKPVNPRDRNHMHRLTGTWRQAIHVFGDRKPKMVT